jgi:hypothetical protein
VSLDRRGRHESTGFQGSIDGGGLRRGESSRLLGAGALYRRGLMWACDIIIEVGRAPSPLPLIARRQADSDKVCLWGKTGSRGRSSRMTRLTQSGHSAAWTYAAKALTVWLRVKRREFIRLIDGAAMA